MGTRAFMICAAMAAIGIVSLGSGCGGSDGGGRGDCGPSACGACPSGTRNTDVCMGGEWQCGCEPEDAGRAGDAGAPVDASSDGGSADAGSDAGGVDAGGSDAGGADAGPPDAGPVSCTVDTDCPSGTFCRDTMAGGRECVPYSMEGESCGGFVPAWAVRRCEPGTGCVAISPLIADAPGRCAITATITEILAMPSRFDGHAVAVLDGWVLGGPPACTRRACPPSMPCCNDCSSGEFLADAMSATSGISLRDMASTPYACMGDECMPYTTCTATPNMRYRIIGRFVASGGGYIEVLSIQPLP